MAAHPRTCRLSVALVAFCANAASAATSVTDVLRALSATGVDVLYSSDLVPPELEAPTAAYAADPLSRAVEVLNAHHLVLRSVGPRRYVVTRAADPPIGAAPVQPIQGIPELEQISVFASHYAFSENPVSAPAAFTRRDIEAVPGAQQDPMRAIRAVPGIATNLSARPYVRGAFLDDVLVNFDGIVLTDPFHFKNFQSLISAFDPAALDKIDIYTGGFPAKYGTRSAAVIDLAPRAVQSGHENRIELSRLNYDVSSVGHAERLPIDWLVAFRHSIHDIALKPINGDIGEPSFVDALGRIRFQANDATAWTFGWLLLDDRVRLSTDPITEQANAHDRDVYSWVASDWSLTGAMHARTSLSFTNTERRRSGSLDIPSIAAGTVIDERDFISVDLRTDWTYAQSELATWNFGAAAAHQKADLSFLQREQFSVPIAAAFTRPIAVALGSVQAPRSAILGVFASGRRRWHAIEAEVGARLDRQDYLGFGARSQLSPRFNLRLDLAPAWQIYGSWGRFTQAQRVEEWRSEERQTAPDPATRAVHLIAGLAHESADMSRWRLEIYRNHWSQVSPYFDNSLNALSLVPELRPDRLRIAPRDAETEGVEVSVRKTVGKSFAASAAYALSRTSDDVAASEVPRSWDQTHAVNLDLGWRRANTAASLLVGWHSGWPRASVSIAQKAQDVPSVVLGSRNSLRWGDFATVDLRIVQTVPLKFGVLSLWTDTTNVLGRANPCCSGISSTDPTTYSPAITTNSWMSRVINVGFTWQTGSPP